MNNKQQKNFPLTLSQTDIYYDQVQWPNTPLYNIGGYIKMGTVDQQRLSDAHRLMVNSFDAFGIRISAANDGVTQTISMDRNADLPIHDVSLEADPVAAAKALIKDIFETPTAYINAPLYRTCLIKINEEHYWYVSMAHHLIMDGTGFANLAKTLGQFYNDQANAPVRSDQWQWVSEQDADYLNSDKYIKDQTFWQTQWKDFPEQLLLPIISNQQATLTKELSSERHDFTIDGALTAKAKGFSAQCGVSLNQTFLAVVTAYFARFCQTNSVVLGTPLHNRKSRELKDMLGVFTSISPLRIDLQESDSFSGVVETTRNNLKRMLRHQRFPVSHMRKDLASHNGTEHLYDVVFNYLRLDSQMNIEGTNAELVFFTPNHQHTPLVITVWEYGETGRVEFKLDYNKAYFDNASIVTFCERLVTFLDGLLSAPEMPIFELPLVTQEEASTLIAMGQGPITEGAEDNCIHEMFEHVVRHQPDATALCFEQATMSYSELNSRANKLARYLIQQGAKRESLIGLCLSRSMEMMVGVLGILKAGAAYVPIDPDLPRERIEYILGDSAISTVVTQSHLMADLPFEALTVVTLDERIMTSFISEEDKQNLGDHTEAAWPYSLAYIIYTSGSTGRPKGVALQHSSLCNFIHSLITDFRLLPTSKVLQFATLSFDASVLDWAGALCSGAQLHLISSATQKSPEALGRTVAEAEISHMTIPPILLSRLNAPDFETVTDLAVAGDACALSDAQTWAKGRRFYNAYGPTEGTILTTLSCFHDHLDVLYLGKPMGNIVTCILDKKGQLLPEGAVGELYIGGAGLARGYVNNPQLTDEKFVSLEVVPGQKQRLYRTGDLVRWLPGGNLEFMGRSDQQIKLRGFRIELGEIENVLLERSEIAEVAVQLDPASKKLVAYVVSTRNHIDSQTDNQTGSEIDHIDALQNFLSKKLPAYMIPGFFVFMSQLPMNANGKLDRKKLPSPPSDQLQRTDFIAPRNWKERKLCEIWQQVLKVDKVSVADNFFLMGGDSILATQIVSSAAKAGIKITMKQLFSLKTIEQLALNSEIVSEIAGEKTNAVHFDQRAVTGEQSLLPIHIGFLQESASRQSHYNQSVLLTVQQNVTLAQLHKLFIALYEKHDVFRLRFTPSSQPESSPTNIEAHWTADYTPLDIPSHIKSILTRCDQSDIEPQARQAAMEAVMNDTHSALSLSGVPLKGVLFPAEPGQSKLFIAAHHLYIDGVSWRILLNDLNRGFEQLASTNANANSNTHSNAIQLESKTTSLQAWGTFLQNYAMGEQVQGEKQRWLEQLSVSADSLPQDKHCEHTDNTCATSKHLTIHLDEQQTQALIGPSHKAYGTQINDLLLAAVYLAVRDWSDCTHLRIDMESHGREILSETISLDQTIGWFTGVYPLMLSASSKASVSEMITSIKEQLRQVNNNGIGFGLLHDLLQDCDIVAARRQAPSSILFNFLGQFEPTEAGTAQFGFSGEYAGDMVSGDYLRKHTLVLNGFVHRQRLQFDLEYSGLQYQEQTMGRLADCLRQALTAVVNHCLAQPHTTFTPSDFSDVEISQAEINKLQAHYRPVADLYPATPMQKGLLFENDLDASPYHNCSSMALSSHANIAVFQQAWRSVLQTHDIFRTVFVGKERWQLVLESLDFSWTEIDLSSDEQWQQSIQAHRREDKALGFDMENGPLIRFYLFRLPSKAYQFHWSFHHVLLDGWSFSNVLSDVIRCFQSLNQGKAFENTATVPFKHYVNWLAKQNNAAARAYWQASLQELYHPCRLAIQSPGSNRQQQGFAEQSVTMDAEQLQALQQFAQQNSVTLNTLFQGGWSYLLYRYTDNQTIVFGETVSGRPETLNDVSAMVGLFLNTLPVNVAVVPQQPLRDWLKRLHMDTVERNDNGYLALSEIQALSRTESTNALFDTLLVFENYPIDLSLLESCRDSLGIDNIKMDEQSHYTLTVQVTLTDSGGIKLIFKYRAAELSEQAVAQLQGHFRNVLLSMIQPGIEKVEQLSVMSAAEIATLAQGVVIEPDAEQDPAFIRRLQAMGCQQAAVRGYIFGDNGELMPGGTEGNLWLPVDSIELDSVDPDFIELDFIEPELRNTQIRGYWSEQEGRFHYAGHQQDEFWSHGKRFNLRSLRDQLNQLPQVNDCLLRKDDKGLAVYVVASDIPADNTSQTIKTLAAWIKEQLLISHIPVGIKLVEQLDEDPLPQMVWQSKTFIAPQSEEQRTLAALWCELLNVDKVGLHDDLFDLGGNSLTLVRLEFAIKEKFGQSVNVRELFEHTDLESQAALIAEQIVGQTDGEHQPTGLTAFAESYVSDRTQLSYAQQRLWFIEQLDGASSRYNIAAAVKLRGNLNLDAVNTALRAIVSRHDILRTNIHTDEKGQPYLSVKAMEDLGSQWLTQSEIAENADPEQIKGLIKEHAGRTFDLAHDVLLRVSLVKQAEQQHIMMLAIHHIIADGWTLNLFIDEFQQHYCALDTGVEPILPQINYHYADYAAWQHDWLNQDNYHEQLAYWKQALNKAPHLHNLPTTGSHHNISSYQANSINVEFPTELVNKLSAFSREQGATLFMVLQSAFALLIGRYSNATDIIMGTPTANRTDAETAKMLGLFVNTVVLRSKLNWQESFAELLQRSKAHTVLAMENQQVPFDSLVEELLSSREVNFTPLFQVMFAVQNSTELTLALPGLEADVIGHQPDFAKFDLTLNIEDLSDSIHASWEYRSELFDHDLMALMSDNYIHMLNCLVDEANSPLNVVCTLTGEDTQKLNQWRHQSIDLPRPIDSDFIPAQGSSARHSPYYFVLDGTGKPLPVGAIGELAFSDVDDVNHSAQWVKSGELVSYTPAGDLLFHGPVHSQVFRDGYSFNLQQLKDLLEANDQLDSHLITYEQESLVFYLVVSNPDAPAILNQIRDWLKAQLPEYMLPDGISLLDSLPDTLTEQGSDALPEPVWFNDRNVSPPQTESEVTLAELWCDVLAIDSVNRNDNFFALGGTSLSAVRLEFAIQQAFNVEVQVKDLFEHARIDTQAQFIEGKRQSVVASITPANRDNGLLPLSFSQQRLWFIQQVDQSNTHYNMPLALRLTGALNVEALSNSLSEIISRHEVLRTTYHIDESGEPYQQINAAQAMVLDNWELSGVEPAQQESLIAEIIGKFTSSAFDLSVDMMLRGGLIRLSDAEHILVLTLHHIASDGWSMGVLIQEATALYNCFQEPFVKDKPLQQNTQQKQSSEVLPALSLQYADYAAWQHDLLQNKAFDPAIQYWKQQLQGIPALHALPTDNVRPDVEDSTGAMFVHRFDNALHRHLSRFSNDRDVTLFMTLQTAFALFVSRYSGESDIVMGTPVANRGHVSLSGLIGFFVNTLVLRTDVSANPTFTQLLQGAKANLLKAYEHQKVPFDLIVDELKPHRSLSYNPIFQIMFAYEEDESDKLQLTGLSHEAVEFEHETSQFDLTLSLRYEKGAFMAKWEYATALFNPETIQRMAHHFEVLLNNLLHSPDQNVDSISFIESAVKQLRSHERDTVSAYDKWQCVHQVFESYAAQTPDKIALEGLAAGQEQRQKLTYAELDQQANQFAHYLIRCGVKPGDFVGICLERSCHMIIALLGVMKAGAAYIPLDPGYPKARLHYMAEDAKLALIISQEPLAAKFAFPNVAVLCIDSPEQQTLLAQQPTEQVTAQVSSDSTLYVIYTSGSTGNPKGVQISHRNIVSYREVTRHDFKVVQDDRVLQFGAFSFDQFVKEFSCALLNGGTFVLRNEEMLAGGGYFWDFIIQQRITVAAVTPALWHQLCADASTLQRALDSQLRLFLIGGEAMSKKAVAQWKEVVQNRIRVLNVYGPTETTISASCFDIADFKPSMHDMPIGTALKNIKLYVLDKNMQPVPHGVVGELHIGGDRVSDKGYFARQSLNESKFIPHCLPDATEGKLYKTGDLVRWMTDGNLAFVGRADHQVKIRGFRIELGEIETRLNQFDNIAQSLVVVDENENHDKRLVAYLVTEQETGNETEKEAQQASLTALIKARLKTKLPDYMLPAAYVFIDAMPVNAVGKVDRKALPKPDLSNISQAEYVPPANDIERQLCAIWQALLNVEQVGIDDNFFDIGGHSLLVTRLITQVRETFDVELSIKTLFDQQTVRDLAVQIDIEMALNSSLTVMDEDSDAGLQTDEKWEL